MVARARLCHREWRRYARPPREAREDLARRSACASLARDGPDERRVPAAIMQRAARHSSPLLTLGVYSHVPVASEVAAIEGLPDWSNAEGGA